MTANLVLSLASLLLGQSAAPAGAISGVVINASRDGAPVAGAEVALRVKLDGEFVVAGEVLSDAAGRFTFDDIPADSDYVYLPGASWQTVHYPGERVQLTALRRRADVEIVVRDTIQSPTPLVVRRHRVVMEFDEEALQITETMEIENPAAATYVGQPSKPGGRAATLQLSIPADFQKVTFHDEFLGRRFVIIDDRLLTDIPWTPGSREVKFTYILPNDSAHHLWQRTVDLPTDVLTVRVQASGNEQHAVTSSSLTKTVDTEKPYVTFSAQNLPAGERVRIQLGHLSAPWMSYARWGALAFVVLIIIATMLLQRRFARQAGGRSADAPPRRKAA